MLDRDGLEATLATPLPPSGIMVKVNRDAPHFPEQDMSPEELDAWLDRVLGPDRDERAMRALGIDPERVERQRT